MDQPVASTSKQLPINKDLSLTTLYVTKLADSVTSEQLAKLFSDHGPIKSAFVVPDKDNGGLSRGFGYVKMAVREDCDQAIKSLNGTILEGKKIGVEWANRRTRDADKDKPKENKEKTSEKPKWIEKKQKAKATPEATNVPSDISSYAFKCIVVVRIFGDGEVEEEEDGEGLKKGLYKKSKKLLAVMSGRNGDADRQLKVDYPVKGASSDIAHIHAPSPRLASLLSVKLNNHVLKGHLLLAHLLHEASSAQRKGKNTAGGRLVVRNLAFDITTEDILTTFCPFGPIAEVDLPSDKANHNKGFAFVWFLRKSDAEKAMTKVNGKVVKSGSVSERIKEGGEGKKQTRQRLKKEGTESQGRIVAVDWALSKDAWQASIKESEPVVEEQQDTTAMDVDAEDASEEDSDDSGNESDGETESDFSPEEMSEFSQEEDDDEDDRIAERETSSNKQGKEQTPGTTLFVRNVQFEATEDELYALFKSFGPVRYARIVVDQTTNRSKGTGFVCFYKDSDAQSVLALSEKLSSHDSGKSAAQPINPFAAPSVFTTDPSSASATSLTLHGRVLGVSEAVSRDDADRLREDRDRKGEKKDRRSLYLLREGVIAPETPEAAKLSATDLDARSSSYEARKRLLRTNPSLFVSRTRLSIRQLPLFVTENILKKLATFAIKQFNLEYKDGSREGLSPDELRHENEADILGGNLAPIKIKTKKDGTVLPPKRVRQAKILRQDDRLDAFSGKGRSKGYGFLDFAHHADALRAVRWLNGNHGVGKQLRQWWSDELQSQMAILQSDKENEMTEEERNGKKKRFQQKLGELKADAAREGGRMIRTVIAEFSVENIQTVRRREQKVETARNRRKEPDSKENARARVERGSKRKSDADVMTPAKKAKLEEKSQAKLLGSIISRKRKAKKQSKA